MSKQDEMKEARRLWASELRSGKWKQGAQLLCRGEEYCCLGVACELFVERHPGVMRVTSDYQGWKSFDGTSAGAPQAVVEWLGLNDSLGHYKPTDSIVDGLAVRNDSGATFAEIADIIESEPEGLFVPSPA